MENAPSSGNTNWLKAFDLINSHAQMCLLSKPIEKLFDNESQLIPKALEISLYFEIKLISPTQKCNKKDTTNMFLAKSSVLIII